MSQICYWLLRQQNQLLVSIDDNGVAMFPRARADEFGGLVDPILVGHYQGDPCYASEFTDTPRQK